MGAYHVEYELGRGSSGVVYAARDERSGTRVALKVLHASHSSHGGARARFEREANALAGSKVAGVVPAIEAGAYGTGQLWVAMKLIEGPSLAQVLAEHGALPEDEVLRIGQVVAKTLGVLHEQQIVHRDIKPSNVLIDEDGQPLLVDFGVASCAATTDADLTRTGQLLGTLPYMAPEIVRGVHPDVRWDLAEQWSFGALLYELATGQRPLGSPPDTSRAPPRVRSVVRQLLEVVPTRRYPSMATVADDLERARAGRALLYGGPIHRGLRLAGSNLLITTASTLALSVTIAATYSLGHSWRREVRARALWDATSARVQASIDERELQDATSLIDAFVDDPEVTGTEVVGRALLRRAEVQRLDLDDARALSDAARVLATYPSLEGESVRSIAETLWAKQDLATLWRVLPELPDAPMEWRRAAALAVGDLSAAAALARSDEERALLMRWSHRVPLASTKASATFAIEDLDGDGVSEAIRAEDATHSELALSSGAVRELPIPPNAGMQRTSGDGGWLLVYGDTVQAWRLGPEGVRARIDLGARNVRSATADGDQLYIITQGNKRDVLSVSLSDPTPRSIDPELRAAGDHIIEALALDLNGDGVRELIVSRGPPTGFELRAYSLSPTPRLLDRLRLGYAQGLQANGAGALVVSVTHTHATTLFGPTRPFGPDAGLYTVALHDEKLWVDTFTPAPRARASEAVQLAQPTSSPGTDTTPSTTAWAELTARGEVLGTWFAIMDGGRVTPIGALDGLQPVGIWDVDGEGEPELVVRRPDLKGDVTALGAGPLWSPPPAPPRPTTWPELLRWLGRSEAAARAEEVLSFSSQHPSERWCRAALDWEQSRRWRHAARAWSACDDEEAPTRAVSALLEVGDVAAALERARASSAVEPELRAWVLATEQATHLTGAALAPYAMAGGAHARKVAPALELTTTAGAPPALELPLDAVGSSAGVEWRGTLTRAEFSAGLVFELNGPSGGVAQVLMQARDLGSGPFLEARCGPDIPIELPLSSPRASVPIIVALRLERDAVRCFLTVDEASASARLPSAVTAVSTATVRPFAPSAHGAIATLKLDEVRLTDARLAPPPPPLAPNDALPSGPALALALRNDPQRSWPRLLAARGEHDALDALLAAWELPLDADPDDPAVARWLATASALDLHEDTSRARVALLTAREALRRAEGERALALVEPVLAMRLPDELRDEAAHMQIEGLALTGDSATAAALAHEAVQASATPELVATRLLQSAAVQRSQDRTEWRWLSAWQPASLAERWLPSAAKARDPQ